MRWLPCAVLLAACTPYSISGPRAPAIAAFGPSASDVGTVCVIRSSSWSRAVTFIVHDIQQLVGATKGDSYFCYEAEPGDHVIVSDTFDSVDHPGRITLHVEPGARYWLQQDHQNNFGSVTSKLAWLDPVRAQELIAGCDYKVVTSAPGHEPLPPPVPFAPALAPSISHR
ncbi:MAG TPA: hypothetical protein VM513_01055 [Kofleriaceae bacterium]|nr:hypothetical protein [Kofleriaceae bacterium]